MIAEFRSLGVATLHEAAKLDSALDPAIHPMWDGALVSGPAFTVRCARGDNLPIHLALAEAAPGDVLVVDAGGALGGYWGMILTVSAKERGIAGLVIDGGVRDIKDLRELAFPVFARGISVRGTVKRDRGALREPITVGGVRIGQGDLVVGDGVVSIPASKVAEVLTAAREREQMERSVVQRLRRGELTADIYGFRERK